MFLQSIGKPKAAGPEWDANREADRPARRELELPLRARRDRDVRDRGRRRSTAPPSESSDAYDHGPYGDPGYPTARLRGVVSRGDSRLVPTHERYAHAPVGDRSDQHRSGLTSPGSPTAFPQLAPARRPSSASTSSGFARRRWATARRRTAAMRSAPATGRSGTCPRLRLGQHPDGGSDCAEPGRQGVRSGAVRSVNRHQLTGARLARRPPGVLGVAPETVEKVQGRAQVDLQSIRTTSTTASSASGFQQDGLRAGAPRSRPSSPVRSSPADRRHLLRHRRDVRHGRIPLERTERVHPCSVAGQDGNGKLGQDMSQRFDAASQQIDNTSLMLVSDYGKLQAAATRSSTTRLEAGQRDHRGRAARAWLEAVVLLHARPGRLPLSDPRLRSGQRAEHGLHHHRQQAGLANQPDDAQMLWPVG